MTSAELEKGMLVSNARLQADALAIEAQQMREIIITTNTGLFGRGLPIALGAAVGGEGRRYQRSQPLDAKFAAFREIDGHDHVPFTPDQDGAWQRHRSAWRLAPQRARPAPQHATSREVGSRWAAPLSC